MESRFETKRVLPAVLAALALTGCAGGIGGGGGPEPGNPNDLPLARLEATPEQYIERAEGAYVLIDLDDNMLSLVHGDRELWRAPVGTGTGLRLTREKGDDDEWHFSTPSGVFQVQYKEEMPVWFLPDWYYIERGEPVPANDAPQRRVEGQLGVAAVYLGEEIAIHGTKHPELLGKRVSHGCIRLENKFAMRLFHNVQIGTPVVIVGGEDLEPLVAEEVPVATGPGQEVRDTLGARSTAELLARLERQLAAPDEDAAWVPTASRLITRGLKDDADALRGLLTLAGHPSDPATEMEYAMFLADAFTRRPTRSVVSLARIDDEQRERAARAIVRASLAVQPDASVARHLDWPTSRIPQWSLGPDGRRGWQALREAEEPYRRALAADLTLHGGPGE